MAAATARRRLPKDFLAGPKQPKSLPEGAFTTANEELNTPTEAQRREMERIFGVSHRRSRPVSKTLQRFRQELLAGQRAEEDARQLLPGINPSQRRTLAEGAAAEAVPEASRTASQAANIAAARAIRDSFNSQLRSRVVEGKLTPAEAAQLVGGISQLTSAQRLLGATTQSAATTQTALRDATSAINDVESAVQDMGTNTTAQGKANTADLKSSLAQLQKAIESTKKDTSQLPKVRTALEDVLGQLNPSKAGSFAQSNLDRLSAIERSTGQPTELSQYDRDFLKSIQNATQSSATGVGGTSADKFAADLAKAIKDTGYQPPAQPAQPAPQPSPDPATAPQPDPQAAAQASAPNLESALELPENSGPAATNRMKGLRKSIKDGNPEGVTLPAIELLKMQSLGRPQVEAAIKNDPAEAQDIIDGLLAASRVYGDYNKDVGKKSQAKLSPEVKEYLRSRAAVTGQTGHGLDAIPDELPPSKADERYNRALDGIADALTRGRHAAAKEARRVRGILGERHYAALLKRLGL